MKQIAALFLCALLFIATTSADASYVMHSEDLTVTDYNLSISSTESISLPLEITGCSHSDTQCGENFGSVSATISDPSGMATYSWQFPGGAIVSGATTLQGLGAGTYTFTVTDGSTTLTCSQTILTEPSQLQITSCTHQDAPCGFNYGSVSANYSGAGGTATYYWELPGGPHIELLDVQGLSAGTYTFYIADACTSLTCSQTILTEPSELQITRCTHEDAPCGFNYGSVSANYSGAGGTATYYWELPGGTPIDLLDVVGLSPGTYTFHIADACTSLTCSQTILTEPSELQITNCTYQDAPCGFNYGSVSANYSGAGGTATYYWEYPGGTHIELLDVQGLGAGTYTFYIADACTSLTCSQTILTEPSEMQITSCTHRDTPCGFNYGSVSANYSDAGGTATYYWELPGGTHIDLLDVHGLSPGTYTFHVTDACTSLTCSQTIVGGASNITMTNCSHQDATCGQSNGSVTAGTVSGATGTPTYTWINSNLGVVGSGLTATGLGAGTYVLRVSDECTTITCSQTILVDASSPSTPGSITGATNACRGQNGVTYSIASVAGATSYIWTLPSGANGSSASTSITVNFGNSFNGGQICVRSSNSCGASNSSCLSIARVNSNVGSIKNISGPSKICPLQSGTFSVPAVSNATDYNWSATGGLIISSGQNTRTVLISAPAGFVKGEISVRASNCRCQTALKKKTVYGLPGTPILNHNSPAFACSGRCYDFNIENAQDASSWTITGPPGSVVTSHGVSSGSGNSLTTTNSCIRICFPANFVTGVIRVIAANSCGQGATLEYTINATNAPAVISGITSVCRNQSNVQYSIPSVNGASSYLWTITGGTITSGATSRNVKVRFNTTSPSVTLSVKARNSCGWSDATVKFINVNQSCRLSEEEAIEIMTSNNSEIIIYPNPSPGSATVKFTAVAAQKYQLKMFDPLGHVLIHENFSGVVGDNYIEIKSANFASGLYFISLQSDSGDVKTVRYIVE